MYLAFKDLAAIFTDYKGVAHADHEYYTVTDRAGSEQPRGLFVSINEDSGELLQAIANGAIAVIWDKNKELPHYTPNHFPVFFTDNVAGAVKRVMQFYIEKIDGDTVKKMNRTKFVFFNKKLLKENEESYDIAVLLKKLPINTTDGNSEGRG